MVKIISLFVLSVLLFSCSQSKTGKLELKVIDSIYAKPNSRIETRIKLISNSSETTSVLDYRMSCDCVSVDSLQLPFTIPAYGERIIPVIIQADSSDVGKTKNITVTCKLSDKPYIVSTQFSVVVRN
jgi:hypothetical protein